MRYNDVSRPRRNRQIRLRGFLAGLRLNKLSPFFLVVLLVQSLWLFYDEQFTKAAKHKIPRVFSKPTESSPLSPFYEEKYKGYSRAFTKWQYESFPCEPLVPERELGYRTAATRGFLFVKEMKSASTTLAGITARIARNLAHRQHNAANGTTCTARLVHTRARRYGERLLDKSFMWSVVREPVSRLISKYFHFLVSRESQNSNLNGFQQFISSSEINDYAYYFKSMSVRKRLNPYRTDLYEEFLKDLLDGYNFLGVMERMDESLAVLQLILGLETQDMLYLSAKTNGSYERFRQKCIKIQKPKVTVPMKEYVYSSTFEAFVEPDVMVYRAVNASLDLTIHELGRDKVDATIKQLQWAQRIAEERCSTHVKFPCSSDGEVQASNDCLLADVACGYECLDQVGRDLESIRAKGA